MFIRRPRYHVSAAPHWRRLPPRPSRSSPPAVVSTYPATAVHRRLRSVVRRLSPRKTHRAPKIPWSSVPVGFFARDFYVTLPVHKSHVTLVRSVAKVVFRLCDRSPAVDCGVTPPPPQSRLIVTLDGHSVPTRSRVDPSTYVKSVSVSAFSIRDTPAKWPLPTVSSSATVLGTCKSTCPTYRWNERSGSKATCTSEGSCSD